MSEDLTPKEIVARLDEFIVGQQDAKKSVAIALRNRMRRLALGDDPIREEIHPKNIIMIGPTGVGKTEIARRLSKLVRAPFVKVEATKYTEVGYVGRDVESMVRDLVSTSMKMVRQEHEKEVEEKAAENIEERIIDILLSGSEQDKKSTQSPPPPDHIKEETDESVRSIFRKKLKNGTLDDKEIEVKTKTNTQPMMQVMAMPGMEDIENQMRNMLGDLFPKKQSNKKKLKIKDAKKILLEDEIENLLDMDKIQSEAIERAEQNGIIFIDEIDKITDTSGKTSGNISREGVQRDILPLVEGSNVQTRNGQIKTDHILFIAAGAFHMAAVSDLIPELQGRFPIRVELKSLVQEDYVAILQNPKNALSKQYQALLSTDDVALSFAPTGYEAIAEVAHLMNTKSEDIGARRLHTIMEKLLEDISFHTEKYKGQEIIIDRKFVEKQLEDVVSDQDLSQYVL